MNHSLLLEKLASLGIKGVAGNWIKSYLHNRRQLVCINNNNEAKSNESIVKVGVPQGGILSPLLFILFINDLPDHSNIGKLVLFADDASQLISANETLVEERANTAVVQQMQSWCLQNKLFLNQDKTVIMQFKSSQKSVIQSPLIRLSNKSIPLKTESKFLGITIDNTLSWGSHITDICKKVASGCYLIKRLIEVSSIEIVRLVYFANIEARLSYGIILWGSSSKTKRLFTLQKRALRFMAKASTDPCAEIWVKDSCRPLFKRFKVMTLTSLYIFNAIMFIINDQSLVKTKMNSCITRQKCQFRLEKPNISIFKKGPVYAGCLFYNALSSELKEKSGKDFKLSLKTYLIEHCFYNIDKFLITNSCVNR